MADDDQPGVRAHVVFAQQVQRLRVLRGLSQAALAARLTELGYPTHQTAVARIERPAGSSAARRRRRDAADGDATVGAGAVGAGAAPARPARRGVTLDDLLAYSVALGVSPSTLLAPQADRVEVIPGLTLSPVEFDEWVRRERTPPCTTEDAWVESLPNDEGRIWRNTSAQAIRGLLRELEQALTTRIDPDVQAHLARIQQLLRNVTLVIAGHSYSVEVAAGIFDAAAHSRLRGHEQIAFAYRAFEALAQTPDTPFSTAMLEEIDKAFSTTLGGPEQLASVLAKYDGLPPDAAEFLPPGRIS